jgi:hypothetical protein
MNEHSFCNFSKQISFTLICKSGIALLLDLNFIFLVLGSYFKKIWHFIKIIFTFTKYNSVYMRKVLIYFLILHLIILLGILKYFADLFIGLHKLETQESLATAKHNEHKNP